MAAKLKFIANDNDENSVNIENDGDFVLFNVDTRDWETQIVFDYETALAIKKQLELMLKEIEPAQPQTH